MLRGLQAQHLLRTPALIRSGVQAQFDKFTVWPKAAEEAAKTPDAPGSMRWTPTPPIPIESPSISRGAAPEGLSEVGALRPALQARYRDLSSLRHDFPLVQAARATLPRRR